MPNKQHILTKIWLYSKAKGNDKYVLLGIASFADPDGKSCYPSIKGIAVRCGLGERTVQRAISNLIKSGELISWGRLSAKTGFRGANEYNFDIKEGGVGVSQRRGRGVTEAGVGVSQRRTTNTLIPNHKPTSEKIEKIHIRTQSKNVAISDSLSSILGTLRVN